MGGGHFHGYEVGLVILGTSCTDQRLHVLLGVGEHYEGNDVGSVWIWTPEGCAESDGIGGGGEFPLVVGGH